MIRFLQLVSLTCMFLH